MPSEFPIVALRLAQIMDAHCPHCLLRRGPVSFRVYTAPTSHACQMDLYRTSDRSIDILSFGSQALLQPGLYQSVVDLVHPSSLLHSLVMGEQLTLQKVGLAQIAW